MDNPTSIQRYIKLTTKKKLDRDDAKAWFGCVRRNAPPGSLCAVQITKPRGGLTAVSMIHAEGAGGHEYLVPLGRDLSTAEGERVFQAWVMSHPEMEDFQIEASVAVTAGEKAHPPALVGRSRYDALCLAVAKRRHEEWVRDRTDAGWRYGTTVSFKEKTHPLLRPWDQIPDKYRKPDRASPQMVMDLMQGQGYSVVDQGELSAVMKMLRSIT